MFADYLCALKHGYSTDMTISDISTAAQDAAATVSKLLSKYESITATAKPIAAEVNEEVE